MRRDRLPEIVYVERDDDSARWLFWGALLGAGLALLYAPRSGEETRRALQRRLRGLRAATEERLDDVMDWFGRDRGAPVASEDVPTGEFEEDLDDEFEDEATPAPPPRPAELSPREEIERRLAEARARRRRPVTPAADVEEPTA